MPNHIRNKLSVIGPAGLVEAFVATARARRPRPGDLPGSMNYDEQERKIEDFCFHALIPLPPEYSTTPYSRPEGQRCGYDMEVATWGVKWGAYEQGPPVVTPGRAVYSFTTAWRSPDQFFAKVSAKFPDLLVAVSYGGEGPTRGRYAYLAGEELENRYDEYHDADYPEHPGDDADLAEEEVWTQAYQAAARLHIHQHEAWLRETLAPLLAPPWMQGGTLAPGWMAPAMDWWEEQGDPRGAILGAINSLPETVEGTDS